MITMHGDAANRFGRLFLIVVIPKLRQQGTVTLAPASLNMTEIFADHKNRWRTKPANSAMRMLPGQQWIPLISIRSYWHIFTGLTCAEMSQVSGVFQTFSIKESVVEGTLEVLGLGSKRGFMTRSGHR